MPSRVLLVDDSPLRQSFLSQLLHGSSRVSSFETSEQAMDAVNQNLPVDIAVLQYRRGSLPLIRVLEQRCPDVKIVAFGSPRPVPVGVDHYLCEPVLGFEVLHLVEEMGRKEKTRNTPVRSLRAVAARASAG